MVQMVKNWIKLVGCRTLYYSGLLHLFLTYCWGKKTSYPVVIVNYHSFVESFDNVMELDSCVTHHIDDFRKELGFLQRYFAICSLDQVVEHLESGKRFSRPTIAITIDDGFRDNYDLMYPVLQEKGVPVTVFLATDYIGSKDKIWVNHLADIFLNTKESECSFERIIKDTTFSLKTMSEKRTAYLSVVRVLKNISLKDRDGHLKNIEQTLRYSSSDQRAMLNWDEVRVMSKSHVTFGAHTCSHPIMTSIPEDIAQREIEDSKKKIEQELGISVKHFAFPNGRPQDFTASLTAYCESIGFKTVSTCTYGCNARKEDLLALKRIGPSVPLSVFAMNLIRAFKE